MFAYFVRRILLMIPTFIGVTIIAFMITRMVPGGPLDREMMKFRMGAMAGGAAIDSAGGDMPKEALDALKKEFDLDKPWYTAYFNWLWKIVNLDFGKSNSTRQPVWEMIKQRFPVSIYFGLTGFILAYLVCVPLGIAKGIRHGSAFDFVSSATVFIGYSIPGWALGAVLLVLFAGGQFWSIFPLGDFRSSSYEQLHPLAKQMVDIDDVSDEFGDFIWSKMPFAAKAIDQVHHTILPIICYMVGSFATLTVLMKNSIMENLAQDYVRTAYAKGLSPFRVIYLHALRNSLIPLATGLGHALSILMAGSYLIEWVFNINGLGYLGYTAILNRDYTVVMGILAVNTALTLAGNITSDLLYALIDPRIRFD